MKNRFLKSIMSEEELAINRNVCGLLYGKLWEAKQLGDLDGQLKLNNRVYQFIFDRYLFGPKLNRGSESIELNSLAERSQKLTLQLNHWEETA